MSSRAWMPLYIGDYLADTSHLSAEEHGVYLLLLMRCWTKGSIPSDRMQCMCIAHAKYEQGGCIVDAIIEEFFVLEEDGFHNKRIDIERGKAKKSYDKRAGAAKKRWGAQHSMSNADAMHMQPQPQPQPQPQQQQQPEPKRQQHRRKDFVPPTLEEAISHCSDKFPDWHRSRVEEKWSYFHGTDWTKANGEKVLNWKSTFATAYKFAKEDGKIGPTIEFSRKAQQQSEQASFLDYSNCLMEGARRESERK